MQYDFNDQKYMPVPRDISHATHDMIKRWAFSPIYNRDDSSRGFSIKIRTADQLRDAIRQAIELEHATIPPYLSSLYTIIPGTNAKAEAVFKRVVREEMLHMSLACNLLIAVGGTPKMDYKGFVPTYDG